MGIIEYYEGDNDFPAERKNKMKALARKWLNMLNKEYDAGNRVGARKLYETLKKLSPQQSGKCFAWDGQEIKP